MTTGEKLSELLKDDALDNIWSISNDGYKYAETRISQKYVDKNSKLLLPVIDEKFADKNILLLQLLQPYVRDFNKYLAATLVSEGIMDYEYACGRSENQYPE